MSEATLPMSHEDHSHGGTPRSAHLGIQFDDLEQQREADTLGIWAFLATEVMFFGALFLAFTIYRHKYHEGFVEGPHHLKMWMGAINTGVLLCSSYTVVLSVHFAQHGNRKNLVRALLATIALGAIFLVIKAIEYSIEYHEQLVPHFNFSYGHHAHQSPNLAPQVHLFMSFYFIMTAIHALHMIVGLVIFAAITIQAWRGKYSPEYYNPVEVSGLYWHFVDLVWIFLFPLLYLLRY